MNDSSIIESKSEVMYTKTARPRAATISFIKQFARTSIILPGCTLGKIVIN